MEYSKPGFRFSIIDGCVIVIGAMLNVFLWRFLASFSLIVAIVVFHFFLFCNVFRIRRSYELFWAAVFVVNVLAWEYFSTLNWWHILATQLPFTIVLIWLEIANERYHGVGCAWKHQPRGGHT